MISNSNVDQLRKQSDTMETYNDGVLKSIILMLSKKKKKKKKKAVFGSLLLSNWLKSWQGLLTWPFLIYFHLHFPDNTSTKIQQTE